MKLLLALAFSALMLPQVQARPVDHTREIQSNLNAARNEIYHALRQLPPHLRGTIGRSLENADQYIDRAQFLTGSRPPAPAPHDPVIFYCTIESTFDGYFWGRGRTEIEAKTNAKQACKMASRNNGFFCKEETLTCERER